MMRYYCSPCQRPFLDQDALDQHLKASLSHRKKPITKPAQVQATKTPLRRTKKFPPQPQPQPKSQPHDIASSSTILSVASNGGSSDSPDKSFNWSTAAASQLPTELELLSTHCHSPEDLLRNKYLLHPYTTADLANIRRCENCNGLQNDMQKRAKPTCRFHPGKKYNMNYPRGQNKRLSCCDGKGSGCMSLPSHKFTRKDRKLTALYLSYASTPSFSHGSQRKFRAVTLDCEMAGVVGGRNEVILVCAADYFTGAVLLNRLVSPTEKVISWRTGIHGVSKSAMQIAVSQGVALSGWKQAREELWKLIDDRTILVGHALQHDLDVLRMIHGRVVDSAILARNLVDIPSRQWGLQMLCQDFLGITLRDNKGKIHDCLEDVLATREVVLWCMHHQQEFRDWASIKKAEEEKKQEERRLLEERKREKARRQFILGAGDEDFDSDESDDFDSDESDEVLHWSDIAEDLGYPSNYDPWSD